MNLKPHQWNWDGLDAFKIKVIACLCMTADHIGAFMSNSFIMRYYTLFRVVGRIAAPLFLFILIQSIRHTKDKVIFLKRLYIAGVMVGLSNTIFNLFLGDIVGIHDFGNILFTFFYVVFYTVLIEKAISAIKEKNIYACVKFVVFGTISLLPCVVYRIIDQAIPSGTPMQQRLLIQGVRDSLLPALDHLDYGVGFVILGVILYFSKKKTWQCLAYFVFCIACVCGTTVAISDPDIYVGSSFASLYFDPMQCWMILAAPIMMTYNQKRGKEIKKFFYWYYPVHRYLIIIFATIIG